MNSKRISVLKRCETSDKENAKPTKAKLKSEIKLNERAKMNGKIKNRK